MAVDTVTDDLILTEDPDVKRYEYHYSHLRDAAMSVTDSLEHLITTAETAHN